MRALTDMARTFLFSQSSFRQSVNQIERNQNVIVYLIEFSIAFKKYIWNLCDSMRIRPWSWQKYIPKRVAVLLRTTKLGLAVHRYASASMPLYVYISICWLTRLSLSLSPFPPYPIVHPRAFSAGFLLYIRTVAIADPFIPNRLNPFPSPQPPPPHSLLFVLVTLRQ